jgi:hypothetical protein
MGENLQIKSSGASRLMDPYTDALERALGRVIARANDELRLIRERSEAITATAAAKVAEADMRMMALEHDLAERLRMLAELKDGKDGVDGAPGVPGERGADGAPGRDGRDGAPGADGVPGCDGVDGVGERGPRGLDGLLTMAMPWADGVHYRGAVVMHDGSTWQAREDTGREPPHDDWQCLARGGQDGADGRSFTVRGTWSDDISYRALDVVALGGASFAARRDNPGECPGDDWQLIAAQGKRGNPGQSGVGVRGERGLPGPVPVELRVDDEGLLTLVNSDGTVIACDLYPVLAKLA